VWYASGGIREYLQDGVNGFTIKRDSRDIAERIKSLLDEPELRDEMCRNARQTALHYSWSTVAKKYQDLIHEVAEEKGLYA
jgi:glycosyltransferase involved in cell wall biosynthesis